ncbi:MAG: efflux RND transporter permease subunit [Geminicoccaceae bacterium]
MSKTAAPARDGGLLSLFARHPTAGNLLMALMLLAGVMALLQLNRQFFPTFGIDVISVSVAWPGATAKDVEASIIEAVEPAVRYLDQVDKVTATAAEGSAGLYVEFVAGADMQKALSDVTAAVTGLTTLPEEAEQPEINQVVRYDTVTRLLLSGPFSESALKAFAKQIREDLLARGIDRVTLVGARDEEIRVAVERDVLRRLDLTLEEIGDAIDRSSRDVPAGQSGGAYEQQPRALGLAKTAEEVAAIPLRAEPGGQRLTIGEIAQVEEAFDDDQAQGRRHGYPAIELTVQRALTADALTVAALVDDYLNEIEPTLPASLTLERYDTVATLIEERIDLLLRNGLTGFVLVVGTLFLFLSARVAFWVAAGIPISLMAMLGILWLAGMSINMISLFAMILALGIIVDDAIVVGEHAAALRERGLSPLAAAEGGANRMAAPVFSASLTTIAAFLPIFVVGDVIGQIIREVPTVVIIVLIASLIECFLVLPSHMRHALAHQADPARWRVAFNHAFDRFRYGAFKRAVTLALAWRYTTLASALAAFILAVGIMAGGRVGFVFFQGPESDVVYLNLATAPGTPRAQTAAALAEVEAALERTEQRLTDGEGGLIVMSFATVGRSAGGGGSTPRATGDTVAGMHVELITADKRDIRTRTFVDTWRSEIPDLPGIEALAIKERIGGPPGREVDIRLQGGRSVADMKLAALEVQRLLQSLPGVAQIEDDLLYGKEEVIVELTPRGRALGFTTQSVGRQLRDAFEGGLVQRFARGDEEVSVYVSLSPAARRSQGLERFMLRSPTGDEVPLAEVVTLREERGFAVIKRVDGVREVAITADLDENQIRLDQVMAALGQAGGLPSITERYDLPYRFAGKAEEQASTLGDIRLGAIAGLGLIYIILAWVFGSFTRPFAVMLIIPFGLVGAVLGHMLLGYNLTILSVIALLGLSGILVNDSIILVTTIDGKRAEGVDRDQAIVDGTVDRLRAVILTSLTTILGLTPLLFETSLQAKFLIPMAITLVFGLCVTTLLVLFVVPALLGVQHDLGRLTAGGGGRKARALATQA